MYPKFVPRCMLDLCFCLSYVRICRRVISIFFAGIAMPSDRPTVRRFVSFVDVGIRKGVHPKKKRKERKCFSGAQVCTVGR